MNEPHDYAEVLEILYDELEIVKQRLQAIEGEIKSLNDSELKITSAILSVGGQLEYERKVAQ